MTDEVPAMFKQITIDVFAGGDAAAGATKLDSFWPDANEMVNAFLTTDALRAKIVEKETEG